MNMGMKTSAAVMIECVGPRCIDIPSKYSKIRSTSGIMESTNSRGMKILVFSALDEPFPRR
jgi:hypothetical protein